jgi:hypothetical protein
MAVLVPILSILERPLLVEIADGRVSRPLFVAFGVTS